MAEKKEKVKNIALFGGAAALLYLLFNRKQSESQKELELRLQDYLDEMKANNNISFETWDTLEDGDLSDLINFKVATNADGTPITSSSSVVAFVMKDSVYLSPEEYFTKNEHRDIYVSNETFTEGAYSAGIYDFWKNNFVKLQRLAPNLRKAWGYDDFKGTSDVGFNASDTPAGYAYISRFGANPDMDLHISWGSDTYEKAFTSFGENLNFKSYANLNGENYEADDFYCEVDIQQNTSYRYLNFDLVLFAPKSCSLNSINFKNFCIKKQTSDYNRSKLWDNLNITTNHPTLSYVSSGVMGVCKDQKNYELARGFNIIHVMIPIPKNYTFALHYPDLWNGRDHIHAVNYFSCLNNFYLDNVNIWDLTFDVELNLFGSVNGRSVTTVELYYDSHQDYNGDYSLNARNETIIVNRTNLSDPISLNRGGGYNKSYNDIIGTKLYKVLMPWGEEKEY